MSTLLTAVGDLVAWMRSRADALDRDAVFPAQEIEKLRAAGALSPKLPLLDHDGLDHAGLDHAGLDHDGLNHERLERDELDRDTLDPGMLRPSRTDELACLLGLVGRGNLSVGRILEAHVNALHLMARQGARPEPDRLYALWVTDPPTDGLRMRRAGARVLLTGGKQFCSAAGHATAALVTARDADGDTRMLTLPLGLGETVTPLPSPLQGMRAAVTGTVDFTGCEVSADRLLGRAGDYMREPDFSAGAWRGSAVALGGLIALIDHAAEQLRQFGRLNNPHVQARLGQAIIARETSRLWVKSAARVAEDESAETGYRVATVGLARIAVETACLDAMRLVQRSVGLSAFRQGNPIELICRDLSTYLRQPAPDEVLTEAATWFADHAEHRL
ncbi:acyl-CoA dehydrogenase [Rhodopila sp.]|uniref:acyl-CoA dehydrogenase n=1 Tax=Rhodopila sp. TaxID=2480087 RepID=UPI003D0D33AA